MRFDNGADQAEGLRRLLVADQTRLISVLAGKPKLGKTSVTINLAAALKRSGKDVLVLDENSSPNNLLDSLGLYARYDLLDVVQGKCVLREALLGNKGFAILSTMRLRHALLSSNERQHLENVLTEIGDSADVVLLDAALPTGQTTLNVGEGMALLLVVDATTSGITESYALIKRMIAEHGRLNFGVLINKAGSEQAALTLFANMDRLARRNLATRLEYAGYIPRDEQLQRATRLSRPVFDAFPRAISVPAFAHLAQQVMRISVQQDSFSAGAGPVMKNVLSRVASSLSQHSREMVHAVN